MDGKKVETADVSVPDALAIAVGFHRQGWLAPAEEIYREVLRLVPNEPNALHYLGVLRHQAGESDASVELIRAAIAARPDWFDAYNNLGNVLKETGRLEEAAEAYRRASDLSPGDAGVRNNLGVVLKVAGRLDEAESTLRGALDADPGSAEAWHNLGNVLARRRCSDEAIEAYRKAVGLKPKRRESWRNLAHSLARAGRREDARRVFDEWEAFEPDNPGARHLRAAILGEDRPDRANDSYVRDLFAGMAGEFDTRLAGLDYRAPEIVASELDRILGAPRGDLGVLDAGAGTGLCGRLLRSRAARMVAVDLSKEMLALAAKRGVYDRIETAELTAWLASEDERFDLAVSADTLVYFGALESVLAGFARVLRPAGLLAFTLERAPDEPAGTFRLDPHGRYSHAESYVRRTLSAAGFDDVALKQVVPRMELGEPVDGLLVTARRRSETD
jgi:predicted TPR repeat methyltransferase